MTWYNLKSKIGGMKFKYLININMNDSIAKVNMTTYRIYKLRAE